MPYAAKWEPICALESVEKQLHARAIDIRLKSVESGKQNEEKRAFQTPCSPSRLRIGYRNSPSTDIRPNYVTTLFLITFLSSPYRVVNVYGYL